VEVSLHFVAENKILVRIKRKGPVKTKFLTVQIQTTHLIRDQQETISSLVLYLADLVKSSLVLHPHAHICNEQKKYLETRKLKTKSIYQTKG